jgi:DtxR family Mn-dependent transcriptional regulator
MTSINTEDYLKTIYGISSGNGDLVSTTVVAEKLDVSKAAASEMAKKLSERGLINYARYKGIKLTDKGETAALKVIRRHRLWELFLMNELGLSWSEVHDEAERLEHQTSEFLINKIDQYLDYPEFDPHGDPIPNSDGKLPKLPKLKTLNECEVSKSYKIVKVNDSNSELINYFTRLGLTLNTEITVLEKLSFDNSVVIQVEKNEYSLSEKISENLFLVESDK